MNLQSNLQSANLIAVYGSLKKDKYNHRLLGQSEFKGNTKVKGILYSVGSYPVILDGDNEYDAEVYEVPEKEYVSIESMELGAGYEVRKISTEWGEATVFYGTDYYKRLADNGSIKEIETY